jgi:hypothetical protein
VCILAVVVMIFQGGRPRRWLQVLLLVIIEGTGCYDAAGVLLLALVFQRVTVFLFPPKDVAVVAEQQGRDRITKRLFC